ncbi:MAG: hypothetical protein CMJ83_11095 [Planctomycetes bacterium]|nr:hypothetical protein [Planctomycetota bacterium]
MRTGREPLTSRVYAVDEEDMEIHRADRGVTFVLVLLCVVVAILLAGVVIPRSESDPESPEAVLASVAGLVRAAVSEADQRLPEGVDWLHGPGRLPEGLPRKTAWPLRSWLDQPRRTAIPWDPWKRAIVVRSGRQGARSVLLVICAGADGIVETGADGRPRGDDLVHVIG